MRIRTLLISLLLLITAIPAVAADGSAGALLTGVREIGAPGAPGGLAVIGDKAFAVVAGAAGKGAQVAVVAAAEAGAGRVVAFGHDGYLNREALETLDTGKLLMNAIAWTGRGAGTVAAFEESGVVAWLKGKGVAAEVRSPESLQGVGVLILNGHRMTDAHEAPLRAFLERGGGLIVATTGWGWAFGDASKDLARDFAGNRLLARYGLIWTRGMAGKTTEKGYAAGTPPSPMLNAARALAALEGSMSGGTALSGDDSAQAAATLVDAVSALPPGDPVLLPRIAAMRARVPGAVVPLERRPVRREDAVARLMLALDIATARSLPPDKVAPHPAGVVFPGDVPPNAKPVTRTVTVDTRVPDWHGTGLYAAPGMPVTVRIPAGAAVTGLGVRIGCHSDRLWSLDTWKRAPDITVGAPLRTVETRIAGAFGGPVYVTVPAKAAAGDVEVTIEGAFEAPRFVLGQTDAREWRERLRWLPGPWAELETRKIVLTVPSRAVRDLDDPAAVLAFYDRGMDAVADLIGQPRERRRPERIVADVQISAGYMHSGYPIMTWLDVEKATVDLASLQKGAWGHWHEIGHNHQSGDWTFAGTGEVTNNLFVLYVFETLSGIAPTAARRETAPAWIEAALKKHTESGAPFAKLKDDPFLFLGMYVQLQQAFGWDAFKRVFAEYRDLPAAQRPKSDDEKRDQWMVRFSRTVGRNLGPFFQRWGVPTSEKARAEIASLPAWMP